MSAGGITAEPPVVAAPPPSDEPGRLARYVTGAIFLAPALALLAVWMVYPAVYTIVRSFFGQSGYLGHWVAIDNYRRLWTDPVERGSLVHLGILFCFYAIIPTAAGLAAAAIVRRVNRRGMGFFRVVFFLPQVIVTVVAAIVWTWILAPSGPATLNGLLHAVGLGPEVGRPWLGNFNTALVAVGLVAVWLDFGLCFVLFLAGIQRIPPDLYDAARIDGAGLAREFFSLTVPLLRREIGAALTISVVAALQSFTLIYQATNGGPGYATMVPGLLVYRYGFELGQVGAASALGIAMTLMIFGLTFAIRALIERNAT